MRSLLFAIQKHHLRAGAPDPLAKKTRIWSLLESMKRAAPAPARKLGVTTAMLVWLQDRLETCEVLGPGEQTNRAVLWAALTFGFFFLARAGEYLAVQEVDTKKVLRGADIIFKDLIGLSEACGNSYFQGFVEACCETSFGNTSGMVSSACSRDSAAIWL
eukprot:368552-Amphidinium_carterae.2